MEDSEIIRRVKQGETEAFSLLVEKYHRRLLTFIFRLVADPVSVEDIGQEVFLNAYKSLPAFDEGRGTPFSAWLFIIARNRCISEIRRSQRLMMIPLDQETAPPSRHQNQDEILMEHERRQALKASLDQLPEPYRGTILRSLEGEAPEVIALADGIAVGTVKSRLFRARKKLKALVRAYIGGKGYGRI
jgi:RNA polymerase sigma-70 factor (ECF subfamily)